MKLTQQEKFKMDPHQKRNQFKLIKNHKKNLEFHQLKQKKKLIQMDLKMRFGKKILLQEIKQKKIDDEQNILEINIMTYSLRGSR